MANSYLRTRKNTKRGVMIRLLCSHRLKLKKVPSAALNVLHEVLVCSGNFIKGELNAKTYLFLFEFIGIVD